MNYGTGLRNSRIKFSHPLHAIPVMSIHCFAVKREAVVAWILLTKVGTTTMPVGPCLQASTRDRKTPDCFEKRMRLLLPMWLNQKWCVIQDVACFRYTGTWLKVNCASFTSRIILTDDVFIYTELCATACWYFPIIPFRIFCYHIKWRQNHFTFNNAS